MTTPVKTIMSSGTSVRAEQRVSTVDVIIKRELTFCLDAHYRFLERTKADSDECVFLIRCRRHLLASA